jgi:hypothetical protein
MPGHIAPAYVAVDANTRATAVRAGWFGECSPRSHAYSRGGCAKLTHTWIMAIEREWKGQHKRASDWSGAMAAARVLQPVAATPARGFGPRTLQEVRRRLENTLILRKQRLPEGSETFDSIPRSRQETETSCISH